MLYKSCIQEDKDLEEALIKLSQSDNLDVNIPVSSMSRATRKIIGLGFVGLGFVIAYLLLKQSPENAQAATPSTRNTTAINAAPQTAGSAFFTDNSNSNSLPEGEQTHGPRQ